MTTNKPEVFRVLGHRLRHDGPVERLPYDWVRVVRLSDYEALQALCDRLQLEAQCHAQEARTANATIAEIYRLVSGGTGEPGSWNGSEPVRRKLEEMQAECKRVRGMLFQCEKDRDQYERDAERYRWLRAYAYGHFDYNYLASLFGFRGEVVDAMIDAAMREGRQ